VKRKFTLKNIKQQKQLQNVGGGDVVSQLGRGGYLAGGGGKKYYCSASASHATRMQQATHCIRDAACCSFILLQCTTDRDTTAYKLFTAAPDSLQLLHAASGRHRTLQTTLM